MLHGLDRLRKEAIDDAGLAPWLVRLEMDVDRATDPVRALAGADRMERAVSSDTTPEIAFEAAMGRAETLDVLDRQEDAALAYREAARREADWGAAAPLGEGRSSFFERQRSAFRSWVDFAVRRAERAKGSPEERARTLDIADVMRWSMGRFAASLAGGAERLPQGAFLDTPPPPAGEVHLYYHPVRDGFVAVGLTSTQAKVARIEEAARGASVESKAATLLGAFAEILGARAAWWCSRIERCATCRFRICRGEVVCSPISRPSRTASACRSAPRSAVTPRAIAPRRQAWCWSSTLRETSPGPAARASG